MSKLQAVLLLCLAAGLTTPIGALSARMEHFHLRWLEREVLHGIVAFGGGALLSAVALVLVPEVLALGATFAQGARGGAVLFGGLIALQNLPEGFNAYQEMQSSSGGAPSGTRLRLTFVPMALLGPLAGGAGYLWLAGAQAVVSAIMLFAAGGILYAVDIAAQAILDHEWAPPLGAVLGFVLGVAGHLLTTGG